MSNSKLLKRLNVTSLEIVKRFFVVNGFAFLARSVSIFITFLPKSNKMLINESVMHTTFSDTFFEATQLIVMTKKTVNDMMFSGHTSVLLTFTLCIVLLSDFMKNKKLLKLAVFAFSHIILILIISTRKHYTVDVYISYLITSLIYISYAAEIRYLRNTKGDTKKNTKRNIIDRVIVWYEMIE